MKVYISGGCKNGKSTYAQNLAQKIRKPGTSLYYLATMIPTDNEDKARIARHREEREGCGFETVEVGRDIHEALKKCDKHGTFLLDSVTALLANEMFPAGDRVNFDAHIKVSQNLTDFINQLNDIVIVSDFIFSDALLYDEFTEAYRRGLAYIDRQTAKICDTVLEFCYGTYTIHKGAFPCG